MDSGERINRLIRELAGTGVAVESDDQTNRLVQELSAEKEAQLEGAKAVLKPLTLVAAILIFVLCFWRYDLSFVLSIVLAAITIPVVGLGIAVPIGYVLGKRAAQRFKMRVRDSE